MLAIFIFNLVVSVAAFISSKNYLLFRTYLVLFLIMYGGSILQLDISNRVHLDYLLLIEVYFCIYVLLSFGLRSRFRMKRDREIISSRLVKPKLVWFIFVFSLLVSYLYYKALGYNLIGLIISGVSSQEISTLRLESYSGSSYYAPGYVNQFKNLLLPLTYTILLFHSWKNKKNMQTLILLCFLPIVLLFILGTGQRAFLMYTFVCVYIGLIRSLKVKMSLQIIAGSTVIFLFGISSYYLGRISDMSVISVVSGILERVLLTEQYDSIVGFEYIYSKEVQFGYDWAQSLLGILPGHKGSTLQHEIFEIMHGTDRGTGAISTLGSIYYNFGVVGIIFMSLLTGVIHYNLDRKYYMKMHSIEQLFIYAFIIFYIANWVSGDIMYLLNKGVFTLLIFSVLIRFNLKNA